METKIETKRPSDPVFVTDYHGERGVERVEIRIGERRQGESRYADMTPWQARRLAVALIWAASGEEPHAEPHVGQIFMTFPRKSKPK